MKVPTIRDLVLTRWTAEIILFMGQRPANKAPRFNHMLNGIKGISDRVLTERLREMEVLGLATRDVEAGPPIRVTYGLTAQGVLLFHPLEDLTKTLAVIQ